MRRAAVLGLSFEPRRLSDVLAPDMPLPGRSFWDRLSTVFARDARRHVRFRRPALQEVAYSEPAVQAAARAAPGRRAQARTRAGGDLRCRTPAVLSNHFALAGDHVRAHRYAMLAAKRATERFSHADAVRLYRRAIDTGRA